MPLIEILARLPEALEIIQADVARTIYTDIREVLAVSAFTVDALQKKKIPLTIYDPGEHEVYSWMDGGRGARLIACIKEYQTGTVIDPSDEWELQRSVQVTSEFTSEATSGLVETAWVMYAVNELTGDPDTHLARTISYSGSTIRWGEVGRLVVFFSEDVSTVIGFLVKSPQSAQSTLKKPYPRTDILLRPQPMQHSWITRPWAYVVTILIPVLFICGAALAQTGAVSTQTKHNLNNLLDHPAVLGVLGLYLAWVGGQLLMQWKEISLLQGAVFGTGNKK